MHNSSIILLLGVLLSVTGTKGSLYSASYATYCVSEHSVCNESLHCEECHPLMWYAHTQTIPNNTEIVFLQEVHFLNSSRLEFSYKTNLRLVGAGIINKKLSQKSVVLCARDNSSGLIFRFSSGINIQGLYFQDCGLHFHGFFAAIYFYSSFDVMISNSTVSHSLGYNLIVDTICNGNFAIFNSVFANSRCAFNHCKNSGNFRVWFNNCPQHNLAIVQMLVIHSWFPYDHQNGTTPKLNGKGIQFTVHQPMVNVTIQDTVVSNSVAVFGGNVQIDMLSSYQNLSQVVFLNCSILNGHSNEGGGIRVMIEQNADFFDAHNMTALLSFDNTLFKFNHANGSGGALYVVVKGSKALSICSVNFFNCNFSHNFARNGGTFYIEKQLEVHIPLNYPGPRLQVKLEECVFKENKLIHGYQQNGDGIVRFQSVKNVLINNSSFVENNGTALLLLDSTVTFEQNTLFYKNWAPYGAAIHICDVSQFFLTNGSYIDFVQNQADVAGGAIYAGERCLETTPSCFYQPIIDTTIDKLNTTTSLTFINNTARLAGDAIYGGSVDNCFTYYKFSRLSRIAYTRIFRKIFNIIPDSPSSVTSDPYGVCFCNITRNRPDCTKKSYQVSKFPGEEFNISIVAVGQRYGIVPALVSLRHPDINITNQDQSFLRKECQIFSVAIFSTSNTTVEFYVSVREVNPVKEKSNYYHTPEPKIQVYLKDCPWIFQFNEKTRSCDCSEVIKKASNSVSCDITSQSFHKKSRVWIGCSPFINGSSSACSKVEVSSGCQYCRHSSHLSFTQFNLSDQCVVGREERLCGSCKSNYSLALGPSKCVHSEENCSIFVTLLLILAFILAGILLVCFLAVFNFTITEGTVNGLLFYANCVHANRIPFFLYGYSCFLHDYGFFRVFISWLNLDLGFQVCFYSGMTAYQKIWLEFGFLLYLFALGGLIVCISRRSIRFTRLVGRNVVPVLATLALIAYPKIIRNTLLVWRCSNHYIKSSASLSSIYVWERDGTVDCFTGKHLPLFIFSMILFSVALLYTLCLFFIQCLQRGTGLFALKWIDKLRPFFDASCGPCRDHHRFWPGLLLLARLFIYLTIWIFEIRNEDEDLKHRLFLVVSICVMILFLLFVSPRGVYKKWQLSLLEFSFFFNLFLASSLILSHHSNNDKEIAAMVSIGLAAVTFLLILVYHAYKRMRGTQMWRRMVAGCREKLGRDTTDNELNQALMEVADEREPLIQPGVLPGSG